MLSISQSTPTKPDTPLRKLVSRRLLSRMGALALVCAAVGSGALLASLAQPDTHLAASSMTLRLAAVQQHLLDAELLLAKPGSVQDGSLWSELDTVRSVWQEWKKEAAIDMPQSLFMIMADPLLQVQPALDTLDEAYRAADLARIEQSTAEVLSMAQRLRRHLASQMQWQEMRDRDIQAASLSRSRQVLVVAGALVLLGLGLALTRGWLLRGQQPGAGGQLQQAARARSHALVEAVQADVDEAVSLTCQQLQGFSRPRPHPSHPA